MMPSKEEVAPLFLDYLSDFEVCEKTIKKHSKSFYRAFSRLPRQKALSIFAIYSFCREADDSIDVYNDVERLLRLEQELTEFLAGKIPNRSFWRALVPVFGTYNMDSQAFYDMLTGQKKDIDFKQPETQAELEDYSYYVAGSVGCMLLPILSSKPSKIKDQAIQLGTAMQLTNILRDVGEDLRKKRIYFPKEIFKNYHVSLDDFQNEEITGSFIAMWEYEAKRAEQLYQDSLSMLAQIDNDSKEALLLSLVFYQAILSVIRKNGYDCFTSRNFVSKAQQIKLYQSVRKTLKGQLIE